MTEEELKQKYEQNQDYQEWTQRLRVFKAEYDKIMRNGVPKIFYLDDDLNTIKNNQSRIDKLARTIEDKY